jgi:hypothetical protein
VESAHVKPGEEWPVGQRVKCPKCGREGVARVYTIRAKGHEYVYAVVNHADGGKCVIKRIGGSRAEPKPAAAPAPITTFAQEAPSARTVEEEVAPAAAPIYREIGPIPREVDRAAWYASKVAASWGSVRENPSEENFRYFANTARQIAVRVGVPVEDAITAVEAYVKTASEAESEREREQAKIRANEAVKFVVARIITASTPEIASFAEEARKRVEEAVKRIEEAARIPEVKVSKEDYAAMFATFRQKKKVAEEARRRAYTKWEEVFAPGRKIVNVEG